MVKTNCDCHERMGIEINSWLLFEELKAFFDRQVQNGTFTEIPIGKPYYVGYDERKRKIEWYATKWYKCKICGVVWEFLYPDFPRPGFVKKIIDTRKTMGIKFREN